MKDLDKSIAFFKAIGFAFNPQFTDKTAACMVMSDDIYAMLLTHDKVKEFSKKPIADADKALNSGAKETRRNTRSMNRGFMADFTDPEGNVITLWETPHIEGGKDDVIRAWQPSLMHQISRYEEPR